MSRTDTVDTTDALHQTGRVPRCVVVENNIGAMQVDTFGKYLCGNDDVEIVLLHLTRFLSIVGIKVLADGLFHLVTIASCNLQHAIAFSFCYTFDGINSVNSLGEDNKFLWNILLRVKEYILQVFLEDIKFWVFSVLCPTVTEFGDKVVVGTQQVDVFRLHVAGGILHIALVVVASVLIEFGNLCAYILKTFLVADRTSSFLFFCLTVKLCIDVYLRAYEDISRLPHVNHIASILT